MDKLNLDYDQEHTIKLPEESGVTLCAIYIPMHASDYGLGFSWRIEAKRGQDIRPDHLLILRSIMGRRNKRNYDRGLQIAESLIREHLSSESIQADPICYQWEPDPPEAKAPTRVDCHKN